jgi:cell division transport system permease protein
VTEGESKGQATAGIGATWISMIVGRQPRTGIMPPADVTGATLVLVVAAMCYLACLAFGAMVTVTRSATDWSMQLEGSLTIQVKPQPDIALEDQIGAALSVLDEVDGITRASTLSQDEIRKLLDPWLGETTASEDLPLPSLIDVELAPEANVDMSRLAERLAAAAPGIELDTHRQWLGELLSAARSAVWLSVGILTLITLTTVAIVVFATRASLAANHESVEVLHLVGAPDEFVANEVQRHFLQLGLRGGGSGLGAAVLTFLAITWLGSEGGAFLLPVPGLMLSDYPWLLLVPAIIALTTTLAARITVLRVLRRMI